MTTETDEKKAKDKRARERADRAIAAASAILVPLGFVRHVDRVGGYKFNEWCPAVWHRESPRMRAALCLQSKPYAGLDSDPLTYRLEVSADNNFGVRATRVAPGNREAVVSYMAKIEAAGAARAKREAQFDAFADKVKELFVMIYPNLKVLNVEAFDGQANVMVRTSTGVLLTIILDGKMRLIRIQVGGDEDGGRPVVLEKLGAALRAL